MNQISVTLTFFSITAYLDIIHGCNEYTCAPIVSKCLLTKSCSCDFKACTCCRECYECLSYLFMECCDCIGLCPTENSTIPLLSRRSHVENLEGIPGLFAALTDMEEDSWTTTTFPVSLDPQIFGGANLDYDDDDDDSTEMDISNEYQLTGVNCTVVFMSQCLSWNKCKSNCQNIGASSYRWFHDGCCECVGSTCINYGIDESQCAECSNYGEDEDEDDGYFEQSVELDEMGYPINMAELDYGDFSGPMDGLQSEF